MKEERRSWRWGQNRSGAKCRDFLDKEERGRWRDAKKHEKNRRVRIRGVGQTQPGRVRKKKFGAGSSRWGRIKTRGLGAHDSPITAGRKRDRFW